MLWFWVTPIIYDVAKVSARSCQHRLYSLYLLNPMTPVVLRLPEGVLAAGHGAASLAFDGDLCLRLGLLPWSALGLLWFAQRVFARAQGNFAQEL